MHKNILKVTPQLLGCCCGDGAYPVAHLRPPPPSPLATFCFMGFCVFGEPRFFN